MELEQTLAQTPLLSGLDKKTISRLAQQGKRRVYEAGETVIREGAPASALYIIIRGKVEVQQNSQTLSVLSTGDFFGELALIEDRPRTASIVAVDETECVLFVAWEFTALLKEYPQIAIPLLNAVIARLHRREAR